MRLRRSSGYDILKGRVDPTMSFLVNARIDLAEEYDGLKQPDRADAMRREIASTEAADKAGRSRGDRQGYRDRHRRLRHSWRIWSAEADRGSRSGTRRARRHPFFDSPWSIVMTSRETRKPNRSTR